EAWFAAFPDNAYSENRGEFLHFYFPFHAVTSRWLCASDHEYGSGFEAPIPVSVEKILSLHATVSRRWPCASAKDFLNLIDFAKCCRHHVQNCVFPEFYNRNCPPNPSY